ncbi:MAG: MBL fold metallo-hydrolase [Chloroflexota bacterium]|nr:MBL fold metallo-hydrolase [Chloroflexota bacterium]
MFSERVSDNIFIFTSEMYAQVTAGVILTTEGAIVIDTLPFPRETQAIVDFIQQHHPLGVRYVVNTHYHADHTYGNYLFPEAEIVSHAACRRALLREGEKSLKEAKEQAPELEEVSLRVPEVVFERGQMIFHLGGKTTQLIHTPGHSSDCIVVYIAEDKVLFGGDTVMPVPFIVDGDWQEMVASLRFVQDLPLENIVQGHGEVLLRGEIPHALKSSISYLQNIHKRVNNHVEGGLSRDALRKIGIEQCGKSRIPLNGLVQDLHRANLLYLYDVITTEKAAKSR